MQNDSEQQTQGADEMERRFELITRTAGIGHWQRGAGEANTRWSDTLLELYGLAPGSPTPSMREWLAHFVHPDDQEETGRRVTRWLSGAEANLTMAHRIVRSDSSVRHILSHARHDVDPTSGLTRASYGVVIDLTEQRQAEIALHLAAERAALAAQGIGMGTWELNVDTGQSLWDEQMWKLRGQAPRTGYVTEAERVADVHPDDRQLFRRESYLSMQAGVPLEREFRVLWPDGTVRWLASRSTELAARPQGQRLRVGVNWDITDKYNAQAARQARETAQSENQAKSEFSARMSHELRTPLNAVMGFSQLLLADPQLPAQYHQSLRHIHTAGQHLLSLTNDALDLSSLQSGSASVQLAPLPLADLVGDTLPMLAPMVQGRAVHVHCGALGGVALADSSRLRQLLVHLVGHAIRVTPDGGRVQIEALPGADEACVLLRVTDGGAKLNALQKQALFEPFQRMSLQSLVPHAIEGTGVGLAIVKALAQCMGGSVQVNDANGPGCGSLFELRLRAAAAAPLTPFAASAPGDTTAPAADPAPTSAQDLRGPDASTRSSSASF
jgi:signal transduction histidine kinase